MMDDNPPERAVLAGYGFSARSAEAVAAVCVVVDQVGLGIDVYGAHWLSHSTTGLTGAH